MLERLGVLGPMNNLASLQRNAASKLAALARINRRKSTYAEAAVRAWIWKLSLLVCAHRVIAAAVANVSHNAVFISRTGELRWDSDALVALPGSKML
jgi:hypothetical protein